MGDIPFEIAFLPKLVSLDLSHIGSNSKLEAHVFKNVLQNSTLLRELSLAGVDISSDLRTYLNVSSPLRFLDLSDTNLYRKLPLNVFNVAYLETLILSGNSGLNGSLPKVNKSTNIPLKWLDLSSTDLSGVIPYSVGHLTSLNHLVLSETSLSGEIPNSIGHLTSLNHLDLSAMRLSGEIPNSIGHLTSLNHLDLSRTRLSGDIPYSIGNLTSLNYLDLSSSLARCNSHPYINYRSLSGVGFSGKIPYSIGHLASLNTLLLYDCKLVGPLPKSLGNLVHLVTLDLSKNALNGTLPSSLFTLPSLEKIYLDNNVFHGSIPFEFFTQRSLKLVTLNSNQLDGQIDVLDQAQIQLPNLSFLDLSCNKLIGIWDLDALLSSLTSLASLDLSYSGLTVVTNDANHYVNLNLFSLKLVSCKLTVFPQFQLESLGYLNLKSNKIQGSFPLSICNMSSLSFLDMSNNYISGAIPKCFVNLMYTLLVVNLGNNHFQGTIPNVHGNCQVEGLILNGNQLEGEVPTSLSKCQDLEILDLGNNLLNGTFPSWSEDLPQLQALVLKSNKLHGLIRSSFMVEQPFPSLRILDLSQNGFVGPLPKNYFGNFKSMRNVIKNATLEYVQISDEYYSITVAMKGSQVKIEKLSIAYTIIDLSNNRFEREIPEILGSLDSLIVLNLSHNCLTGRIPRTLGNLSEIESLDLSYNHLIGEIPQQLAALNSLEVLNLSQNHLVGRIPQGPQFNTFQENSFIGNQKLCGPPLPIKCEHPPSPGPKDVDEDVDDGFTWEVVMLGYGCGTLVGIAMGYLMLRTRRPKWVIETVDELQCKIQRRRNKTRYVYIGK